MSIKGRSGSLGSGKGMRAELPQRSFPWEITQNCHAGKNQRQSWEASREGAQKWVVHGGCSGAPRDRVPASSCITIGPFCPPPDTPAAARPQTGLLGSGTGRGKTTGPAEQVGTCQEFNLALLNYPARLDFPRRPPSISWDYLVQRWGENDTGGGRTWSISLKSGLMSPPQCKGADRAAVKFNCPQDNVLQCRIYYTFILKTCRLNTLSLNDF